MKCKAQTFSSKQASKQASKTSKYRFIGVYSNIISSVDMFNNCTDTEKNSSFKAIG